VHPHHQVDPTHRALRLRLTQTSPTTMSMEAIGAAVSLFNSGAKAYSLSRRKKVKGPRTSGDDFEDDSDDFEADELGLNILHEPHSELPDPENVE